MDPFFESWAESTRTTLGFFWMALWAFMLGYFLSSAIQVFVTEKRMKNLMGKGKSTDILIGTFFGFISSSCSFSALATTKTLFKKGASFVASMAFLMASTNLVIELGIIMAVFLGWQFVVGEYVGGLLLIAFTWLLVKIIHPKKLIARARHYLITGDETVKKEDTNEPALHQLKLEKNWAKVAKQYQMEWKMVWKDVTLGFTVAGLVAVFVPDSFFESLFINTGGGNTQFSFLDLLEHVFVGPIAAFLTFIGSMGNIPLAALLFGKGVSFAGVMAFIFSDLVVFPVLRINAKYYGWKMSAFIVFLLFSSLIITSLALHYGFLAFDLLPDSRDLQIRDMEFFKADYTLYLNLIFLTLSVYLVWLGRVKYKKLDYMKEMANKGAVLEKVLHYISWFCFIWLAGGVLINLIII
jgi:uncharacterized membrane protein YraQ (UPF0718 family)